MTYKVTFSEIIYNADYPKQAAEKALEMICKLNEVECEVTNLITVKNEVHKISSNECTGTTYPTTFTEG